MKTRYGTLLTVMLAAALACGGSQAPNDFKQKVYFEASSDAVIYLADVATVEVNGVGAVVGAVGPFLLTYTASTGKYTGAFFLTPDTYLLTLTAKKADSTVVGTATPAAVTVTATAIANVNINIIPTADPLPPLGFVITAVSYPAYVNLVTDPAPLSVTIAKAATAPDPTYLWSKPAGTPTSPQCGGTANFSTPTAATTDFTNTVAGLCRVRVTITSGAIVQSREVTIGVAVNVNVNGAFTPRPAIKTVNLINNGGFKGTWSTSGTPRSLVRTAEPTCYTGRIAQTIGSGSSAVTYQPTETCYSPSLNANYVYKMNTGAPEPRPEWNGPPDPMPPIVLTATEFSIGVTYDTGNLWSDTNRPKVSLAANCPNSTTNGVIEAGPVFGSAPFWASFCPAVVPPALPINCAGTASLFWKQPIALVAPATSDLCKLTVTVDNQSATDTFDVYVAVAP